MSNALQPPPPLLIKLLGLGIAQWFQDTWKKLTTIQGASQSAIYVSGLVVSDNSPSGANVSWSACTVYYNGAAYSVAAGSTSAAEMLIWWVVGATSFSIGNAYTPGPTIFAILTNNQGVHDTTWDKVGANSVQENQVLGGFTSGYAPQNPSDVTANGGDTTKTLLSYTGAGGLVSVGITDVSGGSSAPTAPGITLSITFDGGTAQTYAIKPAGVGTWTTEFLNSAPGSVGSGSSANDRGVLPFGVAFKTSCVITLNLPGGLSGQFACTVNWAKKLVV